MLILTSKMVAHIFNTNSTEDITLYVRNIDRKECMIWLQSERVFNSLNT